jgi:hypothetical protein
MSINRRTLRDAQSGLGTIAKVAGIAALVIGAFLYLTKR